METTTILKCPHCGVTTTKDGQAFKKITSLNTHVNIHCDKNPNSRLVKNSGSGKPAADGHTHKYKLIQPINTSYANAINHGWIKMCECGELSK